MSRTRQPSTRRIGAAERAITVLDTLADGGELGTNEIARRTGMTPSTVSRQLGTLAASGLVERVASTGRYRLGIRLVHLANAVLARLDVREVARPHLVALVDATGETATLSVSGRRGRDHRRLRPGRAPDPTRVAARPPVDRARDLGREGDARVLRARAPARGRSARTRPARSRTRRRWRPRSRPCASAATRRRSASASPGSRRSPRRSAPRAASSRRSSPSRARARASTSDAVDAALPLLLERAAAISRELGWDRAVGQADAARRSASARMLVRSSSGPTIVKPQPRPARTLAAQSSEPTRIRSKRPVLGLDELGERRGNASRGLVERKVEQDLDLPAPGTCARATSRRTRRRRSPRAAWTAGSSDDAGGAIRSTLNVRRSSRPWSYAARYQRPVCTTRPSGLSSRLSSSPANER